MKDLGFTNIGNNAGPPRGAKGSVGQGINKMAGPGSTQDESDPTADTHLMPLDSMGTVESGGING